MSDINPDLAAQEVDEDLRRDQLNALWKAYGKYLVGAAVGVVLVVAGTEVYKAQKQSTQEENSSKFGAVIEQVEANKTNAVALWEGAESGLSDGYSALAEFRLATAAIEAGDFDKAIATLDAAATSSAIDSALQQLAQLRAALIVAEHKGDLDNARGRLSVLAVKDKPWYYTATEQLAYIDLQQNKTEEALSRFNMLVDDTATPQSISTRARQFRDMLSAQAEEGVGNDNS
ncbi:tetratricopeptide repeat protein [Kordiimonas laminariae]|uniref:tetratricopeptide repeat protein n=1 Tax=Kordiimonas laminariae TaxID=2917717 RepID=UPI001FF40F88|nr:tetratricopeptide repeat protein [Kordiimonas laminariae]